MTFEQQVRERYREILGAINTTTLISDMNSTNATGNVR